VVKQSAYQFDKSPTIATPCFFDESQEVPHTKLKPTIAVRSGATQTVVRNEKGLMKNVNIYN
jgi:hypothetical protein